MITLETIEKARETISALVKKTPLIRSQFLSDHCEGEVYLKLENQQLTNSFKVRGAFNRITQLSSEERNRGVIAASSGNHAQAVALAAKHLQLSAKIVVPLNTSKMKLSKIKKYDVELTLHGDFNEVEPKARELAMKEHLTYISPYNDTEIIAGQGTIGLEILKDLDIVDAIIVPIGGGGLISGISLAVKNSKPDIQIIGVESEASPVMIGSVKAGHIIDIEAKESIAEGLLGGLEEGAITFKIIQKYVDRFFVVAEETIKRAIALLWNKDQQKVEGAGAIAIAPILEKKEEFKGKTTVAVISGGNIEESLFQDIINQW
ncbi:MAG: threonine/serine dehydratase [Candidatus Hodarchaeota archaeon]